MALSRGWELVFPLSGHHCLQQTLFLDMPFLMPSIRELLWPIRYQDVALYSPLRLLLTYQVQAKGDSLLLSITGTTNHDDSQL